MPSNVSIGKCRILQLSRSYREFGADRSVLKPKYRNRTEIIASVLEATKGGSASKTRIMFNAYLSYEQLNEYLNEVLEKELLA